MSEWRPIESAPKSRYVLVCNEAGEMAVAMFEGPALNNPIAHALAKGGDGYWRLYGSVFRFEPSHWMPLPAPPEGS